MYKFVLLDPRSANDDIFAWGPVFGIEVTVPSLATRCSRANLDPQHTGGRTDVAAIDLAVDMELPPGNTTFATVRADLDSVGAMAVIALRRRGFEDRAHLHQHRGALRRVAQVSAADRFSRGPWPGPRELPSEEDHWPEGQASLSDDRELAAMAAIAADPTLPMSTRVDIVARWLEYGDEDTPTLLAYRSRIETERQGLVEAIDTGDIRISVADADGALVSLQDEFVEPEIAVVQTTHRAATMLGYCVAPVVVCENPEFSFNGGPKHRKVTICAWDTSHCDIRAALADLSAIEPGWGGSPTIGGSPQGVSTAIPLDRIVAIVASRLHLQP